MIDDALHPARRPGFTLIELILVLVIMSVLIAVATPTLGRLNQKQRLDAAARTLVSLHASARDLALRDGVATRLVIDETQHEAWIEVARGGGFAAPDEAGMRRVDLDPRIAMRFEHEGRASGNITMDCRPTGVTQPVAIELTDGRGRAVLLYCPSACEGLVVAAPGISGDTVTLTWGTDNAP